MITSDGYTVPSACFNPNLIQPLNGLCDAPNIYVAQTPVSYAASFIDLRGNYLQADLNQDNFGGLITSALQRTGFSNTGKINGKESSVLIAHTAFSFIDSGWTSFRIGHVVDHPSLLHGCSDPSGHTSTNPSSAPGTTWDWTLIWTDRFLFRRSSRPHNRWNMISILVDKAPFPVAMLSSTLPTFHCQWQLPVDSRSKTISLPSIDVGGKRRKVLRGDDVTFLWFRIWCGQNYLRWTTRSKSNAFLSGGENERLFTAPPIDNHVLLVCQWHPDFDTMWLLPLLSRSD